ncbi:MAG: glycosyltransferase family 4 protein [Myxococcales bacterium]
MNRKLAGARILLVGNYPPPHGGIAVHVEALHRRLKDADAWVRVLALGAREGRKDIAPVRRARELAAQLAWHAALGFLVHAQISGHNARSWAIAAAAGALRRPLSPAPVLTVHSGLAPNFLALGPAPRRLVRAASRGFGRIFAVNPAIERALLDAGVPASRVAIAPAGTGPLRPGEAPDGLAAARARFEPLLACAVAPSPIYGTRPLLAALPVLASRMPRVGLALFGPGRREAVEALAGASGVGERVAFLGELDHARALAVIAACDVFVRPSLADGDALSVREALGLGKPVVATAVGFRPSGARLFRTGDPVDLAEKVERAWREGPRRAEGGDELAPILRAYLELLGRDRRAGGES